MNLKKTIKNNNESINFILLKHDAEGYSIKDAFSHLPNSKELNLNNFSSDYGEKFINFISNINQKSKSKY